MLASKALDRLRVGNAQFASGEKIAGTRTHQAERTSLLAGQEPFAVVLGCSDSRVPVETIFDQGMGDLFVVRVAGNVVAPPIVGSVEFAALRLGARLIVVLGHSKCGAVRATLDEILQPSKKLPQGLGTIVDGIRPAIEKMSVAGLPNDHDALMQQAVRANIHNSTMQLRNDSDELRGLIREDGLVVLGAEYSLETGVVDFFDGVS
jgi:carbonic anhydrase